MVLNGDDHTLGVDSATDSKIRLKPREISVGRKDPNKLIKERLPLVKKEREELAFGHG
jgi:hypothetical protein